jgi:hypothetical protein
VSPAALPSPLARLRRRLAAAIAPAPDGAPAVARPPAAAFRDSPRLHVGCGRERLEGWTNVDLQDLPGVDVVADVSRELPFRGVEHLFAEHFLEHLEIDQALRFLALAHQALLPGGTIRLSTPNLDWVWATHYGPHAFDGDRIGMAIGTNLAFYGWEHRFLWNRELLAEALGASGFDDLRFHRWGESERDVFRGLERHQTYPDTPELPHVLIVEAAKGELQPQHLAALRERLETSFLSMRRG